MTDQTPVSPMQAEVKRSHAFGFEPGNLVIRKGGFGDGDGSGYFWFYERDTTLEDEEGQDIVSVEVPNSELLALRDHLNTMFPDRLSAIAPGGVDREQAQALGHRLDWLMQSEARGIDMAPEILAIKADILSLTPQAPAGDRLTANLPSKDGPGTFADHKRRAAMQAPAGGEAKLREALVKARNQFAFYAREHEAAGKVEKAQTNSRYAEMIDEALAEPAPVGDGRAEDDWVHCSFCERAATTDVDDENGPMPACASCYAAWQLDPGFSGNRAVHASDSRATALSAALINLADNVEGKKGVVLSRAEAGLIREAARALAQVDGEGSK